MFNKIFEYVGPYKRSVYGATFLLLLSVLMSVVPFFLAYQIIAPPLNGVTIDMKFVFMKIVQILVCLVLQAIFSAWGLGISHKAAYYTLFSIRKALQEKFEKLPLGVIKGKGTGTTKKLFVDDVDSLELLLAHSLPEGLANLMIPICVYIFMLFVDWKLALMSMVTLPISFVAMMIMYSVGMKKMGGYYQSGQTMNNTIIEYINGMEVIKIFNRGTESYEKFKHDVNNYKDFTISWYKSSWPWMAIYSSLLPCTIILTLPLGSYFVLQGISTLSDLVLVICLSISIGIPLLKALSFLPTMPQINYKITELEKVIGEDALKQKNQDFTSGDNGIRIKNVDFSYDENKVLNNVSLSIKENTKVAIVGESGSGKSTLAKLLIHYYDVDKGDIYIGKDNICDVSLASLNNKISYVAQDQYLFNTSILENIRIGNLNATDDEVIEAANKAQCMEFINKLPKGIHSSAGDAGKMLSGGQRQRISLARAILKNSPIVVLDEATAYADPENEEKMESAISELVRDKTLIVIAHKLPYVIDSDKIFVMGHGHLLGEGKHNDLLTSCKEYKKLWDAIISSSTWKVDVSKGEVENA